MFIATLFIIAKTWKQSKHPSIDEWINKLCHIHKMECYCSIKRNDLLSHEKTWKNLKCILLSERSQCEKAAYCMILNITTFWKRYNYRDSEKITGCQGLIWREGEMIGRLQGIFKAIKLFCIILWIQVIIHMFVKTNRMYNTKRESHITMDTTGNVLAHHL